MIYLGGIYATERQKYDLSGYIADGIPMVKKYGDKEYSIQKYQGEHSDEYVVMEVENGTPNGLAQLFKRGLIQLSWRMVEGNREGLVRVYKNGKVSHEIAWETLDESFNLDVFHEIINDRSGQRLMVEKMAASGTIVYKGGYDPLTMSKEGYGIEYDEESGVEKSTGFYRNNILIHLYQSFIKEEEEDVDDEKGKMKMIEYDGNESINNVDNVLNLHPIYVGGYRYDEKKNKFVRYGKGNVINKLDGICNRESVWNENGDEIEDSNTELYGGWYGRFDNDEHGYSIRVSKLDEEVEKKRIEKERYWNTEIVVCAGLNLSYTRGIEELVTGTCFMNNENKFRVCLSLNLSSCERLKRVDIGNRSLKYIREFVVDGLNQLESVRIGDWCLCISGQERDDGIFKITNCPKLRELYIGDYSCIDYSQFIVSNVDSLQSIEFIRNCFQFAEKCTIKGKWERINGNYSSSHQKLDSY